MNTLARTAEFFSINVGDELVKYSSLKGLSENELAEELGVSANYVRLIEWGLIRNVSSKVRQRTLELVRGG